MAERRMFAKSIVMSDAFLDMPATARCLYFTLGMFADDDGFVNSPKSIMRQCGASMDDINVLLAKKFIYSFESGVVVIKHWRIHNLLRADRRKDTNYKEEMAFLSYDENGAYTLGIPNDNQLTTKCQPTDNQVTSFGKPSIGKVSIGKDRIGKDSIVLPTEADIAEYVKLKNYTIDPHRFYTYYSEREFPKNWKGVIDKWEKSEFKKPKPKHTEYMERGKRTPKLGDFGTEYIKES